MSKKVVFIADVFADQVPGGGELNNDEFINELSQKDNYEVEKRHSHTVTPLYLEENEDSKFIIGNFISLAPEIKRLIADRDYIIYEHDHKYIKTRNPADYKDYKAPDDQIINYDFYANARAVLCQSQMHSSIVKKNLKLDNIVNLGGNMWSLEILDFLREISKKDKPDRHAVIQSKNWHKNTHDAVKYCALRELNFTLVLPAPYKDFLAKLGENKKLVFFPKTPETLSRIAVEARMMGMGTIINNKVGAATEEWFKLKGPELVDVMVEKRTTIVEKVQEIFDGP